MITEYMKKSAEAVVSALNAKSDETHWEPEIILHKALNVKEEWARLIPFGDNFIDITRYQLINADVNGVIYKFFIMSFMGGELSIGITGKGNFYDDVVWDDEITYGVVKYQPYFSKGFKE